MNSEERGYYHPRNLAGLRS